jgi:myosin-7
MIELERRGVAIDEEQKRRADVQRTRIEDATRKMDEPVDDGKLVEAMFDFLPDQSSDQHAQQSSGPRGSNNNAVFMVRY